MKKIEDVIAQLKQETFKNFEKQFLTDGLTPIQKTELKDYLDQDLAKLFSNFPLFLNNGDVASFLNGYSLIIDFNENNLILNIVPNKEFFITNTPSIKNISDLSKIFPEYKVMLKGFGVIENTLTDFLKSNIDYQQIQEFYNLMQNAIASQRSNFHINIFNEKFSHLIEKSFETSLEKAKVFNEKPKTDNFQFINRNPFRF